MNTVQSAAANPAVSVVTMSWAYPDSSGYTSYNSYFTTPGTKACAGEERDVLRVDGRRRRYQRKSGQAKTDGYPATSPNVVAVGGTEPLLDYQQFLQL